jgi:hypothetical protein
MSCHEGYYEIMDAWSRNASMSDMYHMILSWMQDTKPDLEYPQIAGIVQDWLQRAEDGDETNDLVEAFVYGDECEEIHACFIKE